MPVDFEAGALFLTWMDRLRLGRKRFLDTAGWIPCWLDTLLAASYRRAGVRRIATTDWRDFEVYGVFEVLRLEPS